jgi:hypothetical protein
MEMLDLKRIPAEKTRRKIRQSNAPGNHGREWRRTMNRKKTIFEALEMIALLELLDKSATTKQEH